MLANIRTALVGHVHGGLTVLRREYHGVRGEANSAQTLFFLDHVDLYSQLFEETPPRHLVNLTLICNAKRGDKWRRSQRSSPHFLPLTRKSPFCRIARYPRRKSAEFFQRGSGSHSSRPMRFSLDIFSRPGFQVQTPDPASSKRCRFKTHVFRTALLVCVSNIARCARSLTASLIRSAVGARRTETSTAEGV